MRPVCGDFGWTVVAGVYQLNSYATTMDTHCSIIAPIPAHLFPTGVAACDVAGVMRGLACALVLRPFARPLGTAPPPCSAHIFYALCAEAGWVE